MGCSTPERPSKKYIEAHAELYKDKSDDAPLKPVPTGEGPCKENNDTEKHSCGGSEQGRCFKGKCRCLKGWTGPHCLAHDGFDEIVWEKERKFYFYGPSRLTVIVSSALVGIFILLILVNAPAKKKQQEMEVLLKKRSNAVKNDNVFYDMGTNMNGGRFA